MLRALLPNLTVIRRVTSKLSRIFKNIFFLVMTSSIFLFCCRYPGYVKIIKFYGAKIKLHIFACDMESFKNGNFCKYFVFYCKNWSVIDYTGFRDFSPRILSYAMQIMIVEVIRFREGCGSEWTNSCGGGEFRPRAISI